MVPTILVDAPRSLMIPPNAIRILSSAVCNCASTPFLMNLRGMVSLVHESVS